MFTCDAGRDSTECKLHFNMQLSETTNRLTTAKVEFRLNLSTTYHLIFFCKHLNYNQIFGVQSQPSSTNKETIQSTKVILEDEEVAHKRGAVWKTIKRNTVTYG